MPVIAMAEVKTIHILLYYDSVTPLYLNEYSILLGYQLPITTITT